MKKHGLLSITFLTLVSSLLFACQDPNLSSSNNDNSSSTSSSSSSNYTSVPTTSFPIGDDYQDVLDSPLILNNFSSSSKEVNFVYEVAPGFNLGIHNAEIEDGSLILKKGGYITNLNAYASFSEISVEFETYDELGFLGVRSSFYPITSPRSGVEYLETNTPSALLANNRFFALVAPISPVEIKEINITSTKGNANEQEEKTISFYTINDTHGAVMMDESNYQAGIERLSTYLYDESAANPDGNVILSSGDMWQGSADSNLTSGEIMVNWMNLIGYESMAIGNHEFDWGVDAILENSFKADFPFLGINIADTNNQRPDWAKPSVIIERFGAKIGIIGAIGNLESSIAVSSLGGYQLLDNYAELVYEEAERLKTDEDCDLVVVSIHNDDLFVTDEAAEYIDAVFGGHTHSFFGNVDSNGIPHVQCYSNGSNIWRVDFKEDADGNWYFDEYSNMPLDSLLRLEPHEETTQLIDYYGSLIDDIKNEVVGHNDEYLSRGALADLASESLYRYYKRENWGTNLVGAATNTGCARSELAAGVVKYGDLYQALPFDNDNVLVQIPGYYLRELAHDSYLSTYLDIAENQIDDNANYEMIIISYVFEKAPYNLYMEEISRDSVVRLRDIVAEYFRGNL